MVGTYALECPETILVTKTINIFGLALYVESLPKYDLPNSGAIFMMDGHIVHRFGVSIHFLSSWLELESPKCTAFLGSGQLITTMVKIKFVEAKNQSAMLAFHLFRIDSNHLLRVQSELFEQGLELMTKDIRTQPTSLKFIPTPPNLDS